jgi:hypothetical protein
MVPTICITPLLDHGPYHLHQFFHNIVEQFYKDYAFMPIYLAVLAPSSHLVFLEKQGTLCLLPLGGCLCATPLTLPAIWLQALGCMLPDKRPR